MRVINTPTSMPESVSQALATQGLWALCLIYLAAGVVRGFTGFGTALIVVPVAGIFLQPTEILMMIAVSGILSNFFLVPSAWGDADRREVGILAGAALVSMPFGIWLINAMDATVIRWSVAAIALVTLVAVVSGWQFQRRLGVPGLSAIGAGAGFIGGLTALTGPIAIMFYLANARKALSVRANMILFLAALDILMLAILTLNGLANVRLIALGTLVSIPYAAAIFFGKSLFNPERDGLYRAVAYSIVALALVTGLPIWET